MLERIADLKAQARRAESIGSLRGLREALLGMAPVPSCLNIREWVHELNGLYDELIRRSITLAEQELLDSGMGPPPVSYSFVLFGSGGRSEQTYFSDQDNGLIYNSDPGGIAKEYFRRLGELIRSHLIAIGFPPCDGNVICTNDMFNKPIDEWLATVDRWCGEPS